MPADSPAPESPLAAFLEQYWKDQESGTNRRLRDYLDLFPGEDLEIAAEFLALHRRDRIVATDSGMQIGKYRIVRELGRGGQAIVYLAEDSILGRQVALKVLEGLGAAQAEVLARFRREALAASALQHPGICAVYEANVGSRIPYIAMQYLLGETLAKRIAMSREIRTPSTVSMGSLAAGTAGDTPLTAIESLDRGSILVAVAMIEKTARALHAAHQAGVVHRDIKPGNIMISPEGEPTLVDFGLARHEDSDPATVTRSGELFGTPAYMSPEQITRQSIRADRRTDIWSLGVCLYEAVTLRRPFEAPTREALLQAILSKEPVEPRRHNPAMPRDLGVVIRTALEKDRDRRYQTALDFAEDLRRLREHEPILARPPSVGTRLRRWVRREPAMASVVVLSFLLAGVVPTAFWIRERDHSGRLRAERDLSRLRGEEVQAHADRLEVERLLGTAGDLYPALPSNLPRMSAWQGRADSVLARTAVDASRPAGVDVEDWETHLGRIRGLRELRNRCTDLVTEARQLTRRSIIAHGGAWARAKSSIRESSNYVDLALEPQLGLVPFRENPRTHLWEFWVLQSGTIPEIVDPEESEVRPEPGWPIVLVLLPGGEFHMGQDYPGERELIPVVRRVGPFFISKWEVTQDQYERLCGNNPAQWAPSAKHPQATPTNPVEMITWFDAREFARRLALELPSEVQWEYACRGGSATRYWWGDSESEVAECENVRLPGVSGRDKFDGTSPVGSFRSNGFGLHDLAGNVTEWCASTSRLNLRDVPEAPELGIQQPAGRVELVMRGSNYNSPIVQSCASAARFVERPEVPTPAVGVRPSRRLESP